MCLHACIKYEPNLPSLFIEVITNDGKFDDVWTSKELKGDVHFDSFLFFGFLTTKGQCHEVEGANSNPFLEAS